MNQSPWLPRVWGARVGLSTAAITPELVTATTLIYGRGHDHVDNQMLTATGPILIISGSADDGPYPEHATLENRMRNVRKHIESYVYPGADHAFAQPLYNNGKSFDPIATRAMQNVLDNFLERHLQPKAVVRHVHIKCHTLNENGLSSLG